MAASNWQSPWAQLFVDGRSVVQLAEWTIVPTELFVPEANAELVRRILRRRGGPLRPRSASMRALRRAKYWRPS